MSKQPLQERPGAHCPSTRPSVRPSLEPLPGLVHTRPCSPGGPSPLTTSASWSGTFSLCPWPARRRGGRGRCRSGCEASIIPLLASMPFLAALSFLAAARLGAERRLFSFAPASLAGNSRRRPPPRGQGRTGLRAGQQAFVNGPRLPGRAVGPGGPPRRADSHWLDTVVSGAAAGGSFLLAPEQYQGQPGDLPPTPSSFHCERHTIPGHWALRSRGRGGGTGRGAREVSS